MKIAALALPASMRQLAGDALDCPNAAADHRGVVKSRSP
jgi:hypothetical protein